MSKFLININGEFFDESNAKISVFDRGFLYSDSVYEATRTFKRHPFRLEMHLLRLFESAKKIDLKTSFTIEELSKEIYATIAKSPHENISMRIILTRGTNSDLGLDPSLCHQNNLVVITKAIAENPSWWLTEGWSVIFYHKKTSERGSLAKTSNYQENMLAYKAAKDKGSDDALMLNSDGFLTEGTTSNVWMVKNNHVFTPSLDLGLLDGLTRKTLLEVCELHNINCQETRITPEELLSADEIFITSTTRNLVPVTKIEGRSIGSGRPGKMTTHLLKLYLDHVSRE